MVTLSMPQVTLLSRLLLLPHLPRVSGMFNMLHMAPQPFTAETKPRIVHAAHQQVPLINQSLPLQQIRSGQTNCPTTSVPPGYTRTVLVWQCAVKDDDRTTVCFVDVCSTARGSSCRSDSSMELGGHQSDGNNC